MLSQRRLGRGLIPASNMTVRQEVRRMRREVDKGNIMLDAVFLELVGIIRRVVVAEEPNRSTH